MVESVKHAIVLLQIAKNASCQSEAEAAEDTGLAPVHAGEAGLPVDKSEEASEAGAAAGAETDSLRSSLSSPRSRRSPASVSPRISPMVKHMRMPQVGSSKPDRVMKNSTIPAVSYSSSDDDEDDFFDAQDDVASKAGSDVASLRQVAAAGPSSRSSSEATVAVSSVTPLTPSDIDWDSLYEDDAQEEDVDMKSHGSVITHLLSQVVLFESVFLVVTLLFPGTNRHGLDENSAAHLHPGAEIPAGDVRGLLRAS